MKTDFLNNSSVADFQRRLHKLFKPHKLHFRNLKKRLPKKSSNNNGSVTIWLLSPPFWREKLKHVNARAKSIFFLPSLNPAKFSIKQEMINRLVHPIVSDFFKAWWVTWIFHWSSSGCCFKNVSHYMSKTGLFFQSCRHVLNWEGRTRVEWREDFRTRPSPYSRSASAAAQLALHCYSVQHAASRYYWDWLKQAWTTECLLRGASFLLSALCTPYSGVQTSIFRVGAKQNRNWTGR